MPGDLTRPVTPALSAALDSAVAAVADGTKGRVTAGVSQVGLELAAGYKPKSWLDLAGYASRGWSGGNWSGGARVGVSW